MEKLYELETLPEGVDPVGMVQVMTRNVRLSSKNVTILAGKIRSLQNEITSLREDNLMLEIRLTEALSAIVDFQTERRKYRETERGRVIRFEMGREMTIEGDLRRFRRTSRVFCGRVIQALRIQEILEFLTRTLKRLGVG